MVKMGGDSRSRPRMAVATNRADELVRRSAPLANS
jgi:hypothetical protein